MKYSQFIAGAAIASVASAHTTIYNMWVNDVDQGLGNSAAGYIRSPPNNNPLKDITSKDMTCNVNNVATAKTIDVAAGDKLSLEWHHDSNSASDDIIDKSHVGPVMVYIAPTASNGAGDVWVKLAEDGYDGSTWAVEKLIANKGKHDVVIPSTLADGEYLVRGEIIALHEADTAFSSNPARGAQFYMECVQISVSGGGATVLPAGVPMPGTYKYTDPGVVFSIYGAYTSYEIPGPAVWDGASSGGTTPPVASIPATTAAPIASSAAPVASDVASNLEPVTKVPSASVPSATSVKSACKSKTSAAAPVPTKSACKSKSIVAIPTGVPTTLATITKPVASSSPAASVAKYRQCGGQGFTGSTTCVEGTTCTSQNAYYSQCI